LLLPSPYPGVIPVSLLVDKEDLLVQHGFLWRDYRPFPHCFPFHCWSCFPLLFPFHCWASLITEHSVEAHPRDIQGGGLSSRTFSDFRDVRMITVGYSRDVRNVKQAVGETPSGINPDQRRTRPRMVNNTATESTVVQGKSKREEL